MSPCLRTRALALTLSATSLVSGITSTYAQSSPALPAASQTAGQTPAPAKRTVQPADYATWESLGSWRISNDGRWVAAEISTGNGDRSLLVKNNDTPQQIRTEHARGGVFSDDSKWVGYLMGVSRAAEEKLREERRPVAVRLGVRQLESGAERTWENVRRWEFLRGSRFLVVHRAPTPTPPADPARAGTSRPEAGTDLLIVDLTNGSTLVIGNVAEYAASRDGARLAVAVRSESEEGGLQLIDPLTSRVVPLLWGRETVRQLTWARDNETLACLLGTAREDREGDQHRLAVVRNARVQPSLTVLDPANPESGIPADSRISETEPIQVAEGGIRVTFGVQPWRARSRPTKASERADLEIWNTQDLRTIPEQRVEARQDLARTDLMVWQVDRGVRKVADAATTATVLRGLRHAVVIDERPYAKPADNGYGYVDVSVVDLQTGDRRLVLTKTHFAPIESPEGGFLAYYKQRNWWVYDIANDVHRNATESLKTTFEQEENDLTIPERPPVGTASWLANDSGVVVNNRYDAYLIRPRVPGVTALTNGRKDGLRHQFTRIDDEEEGPTVNDSLWFRVVDEETQATGYAVSKQGAKAKLVVLDNSRLSGLTKAKDGDRVVVRLESFEKSPSLLVTNQAFSQLKPTVRTNPQQSQFHWGKAELIDFKSRWGLPLKATLIYPANYDPKRSYPMVTYIYERLTQNFHAYIAPSETSPYNAQVLSQNGYFVLMPDIAYRRRQPGKSAVECLEPAVAASVRRGVGVDPNRVGLIGHSWGGYQTAFVTTVSPTFRVGVAGAPLTELVSMYNTHYWNRGIPNQPLLETSQGRMEVPFWEDPGAYIENSPVWRSLERKAPLLIAQGNQDGAVDYHQGLALYNTLRRMGKDAVFLLYDGENHNFTKRANQIDYGQRLRHFLDVHLKGVRPEPWVSAGIPLLQQRR